MADCSCDYCNTNETCEYAYQELNCEKSKVDKIKAIPKEEMETILNSFNNILQALEKFELEDEDFYCFTRSALHNLNYYVE
jgi:uncharacterized tellurite resistance protein B-like protein